jgi:hypothetical protein
MRAGLAPATCTYRGCQVTKLIVRVLLLLVLVALAGCGGRHRGSETLGKAPQTLETDLFVCPQDFDTIGYRGRSYPSMFPARPGSNVRPDRCFRSIEQAQQAGYKLAATPPGAVRLDDVYLVPPQRSLHSYCRRAARVAGFPVPCPTLVPVPANSVGGCAGLRRCVGRGIFVLEGNFNGPPGYVGNEGRAGHLWFLAAVASKASEIECCGSKRTAASSTVRGHPAAWLEYPRGSELNSGHVVLEWRERGIVYAVSLHGRSELNRQLDALLAARIQMIAPAPS